MRQYLAVKFSIMNIVILLIFLSLLVAVGFLFAFFWAVKTGQFNDDTTPAMRILLEDEKVNKK